MQTSQQQLARELAKECRSVDDIHAKLKELFRDTIQEILEIELDNHLGYEKHSVAGNNSGNSRNGYSAPKTVKTSYGETDVKVPRDRNGEFEPQIIKKYQTTLSQIEEQVLSLYAKGMSTRDIEDQMRDLYGIDVSPMMVSKITDKIMPLIIEWQSRPLDKVYAIVYLDAIFFKVRQDGKVVNKAAYSVLGINLQGQKDILGIWIGESESASFWMSVCNDLRNRGVEDILIICKDGLSGFSEAISAVFPKSNIQLCVIHQIRNSLKYVSYKDERELMKDLKKVYQALTLQEAGLAFEEFRQKWGKKYPVIIRSWEANWGELTTYFEYPYPIRRIIYTTNIIEGYHRQLRKVTKTKTTYPTDDAVRKIIYLATDRIMKKWTMPIQNWKNCFAQIVVYFGDRIPENLV